MGNLTIPNTQGEVLKDGKFISEWFNYFENIFRRLIGSQNIFLNGIIDSDYTAIGNVGGGTDDLITYTASANLLKTTGDVLEIDAFGTFANNGNNKTVSLVFGSTTIFTIGATAISGGSFDLNAKIIRTGASTQKIIVNGNGTNAVLIKTVYTDGTEDLTTSLEIKMTAVGTATDDIVEEGMITRIHLQS
jgi:hypothetical protein